MIKLGKRAVLLAASGVLAAVAVTGCSGSIDNDAVVVKVGDEDVTLGVANFYARMQQGQYETYYASMMGTTGEAMWTQEAGEDKTMEEETKDNILKNLEDLYLISQHASEYEVTLTEDEEKAIAEAAGKFEEDNSETSREAVSGYKKNIEELLTLLTVQSKMEDKMKEGVDEEVSDEEAAQKSMEYVYFSYNTTDDSGNSVTLSDEEKEELKATAEDFAAQVKEGTDMETAAEEAGAEVQTTTFDSESTSPNADLVKAVDALENEGDCTEIIETDNGIYVGKVTSLLDREATDAEKDNIVEQRKQDQYDSLLEEWRDDTEIKEDKKVWKKVDFVDQGVTITTSEDEGTDSDAAGTEENPQSE